MPRVSVIIPSYNRAHLVKDAIDSVLNQTFQDFEVIIVDDASQDNTTEVVNSIGNKKIRYYRHETNKGQSEARNTGIKLSEAEYIAFLDDDDEWMPEKLEKQLNHIQNKSSEYGVIYSGHQYINYNDSQIISTVHPTKSGYIYEDMFYENCIPAGSSTAMVKRECFEHVGLYDPECLSVDDWDMWLRLSKKYYFLFVDMPLVKYRMHSNNLSKNHEAYIQGRLKLIDKYTDEYKKKKHALSNGHYWIAIRYLYLSNLREGRNNLIKAIKSYPFEPRYYFYLFLSYLGIDTFNWYTSFRNKDSIVGNITPNNRSTD